MKLFIFMFLSVNCYADDLDAETFQKAMQQISKSINDSNHREAKPRVYVPLSNGAPFCVQHAYGRDCSYYDVSSCQQEASNRNGMCVPNNN